METNDTPSHDDRTSGDVDEQFRALLEGIRTSLPGVQVLFAFLLVAPLQGAFDDLGPSGRAAFSVAFYASGLASILLIAPSVHQRIRAPFTGVRRQSERHLRIATWLTIVGTVAMGLAIAATTYVVSSLVFAPGAAAIASALIAGVAAWAWFFLPLVTFRR